MSVLDELRALEAQATPAPWHANTTTHIICDDQPEAVCRIVICEEDVGFIAAARNALPALLDIAEAAHRVLAPGAIVSVSRGTRAVVETSQALADLGEAVARLDGRAPLGGDA